MNWKYAIYNSFKEGIINCRFDSLFIDQNYFQNKAFEQAKCILFLWQQYIMRSSTAWISDMHHLSNRLLLPQRNQNTLSKGTFWDLPPAALVQFYVSYPKWYPHNSEESIAHYSHLLKRNVHIHIFYCVNPNCT